MRFSRHMRWPCPEGEGAGVVPVLHAAVLPGGRDAGFTLIEVIVVLVVLGLVGGLVLSRGPAHSAALDMRLASGSVAQALRLARTRAIASNQGVSVVFDTQAGTMQVGAAPPHRLPPGLEMAVTAMADQASGPRAVIRFLPDGSSTGGRVDLAGNGRSVQVGVDWLTGRVTAADAP